MLTPILATLIAWGLMALMFRTGAGRRRARVLAGITMSLVLAYLIWITWGFLQCSQ